ncbi:Hypothetical predicted protein, partial [Paramuricea clavata]
MANKHSRQWLQLAIDIQYSRLHKIDRFVFPLNYHQYQEITRFESSLNDIKDRKLQQLIYRQHHGTAITTTESKPQGFKNLSSETFDSKLQSILNKGPSFVNAEPWELPKLCLLSKASLQLTTDRLQEQNIPDSAINEFRGGIARIIKE